MAQKARYDYRIGAGWNLPLGSLTNVELIKPTSDKYFYPPRSFGTFNPGQYRVRGDGMIYTAGKQSVDWPWFGNPEGRLTPAQAKYLSDTYCSSGVSGKVTVYTKTRDSNSYARYNAVMILSPYPESGINFNNFGRFIAHMTALVPL